ncbi:MAG: hypothetical protein OXM55_00140 [Bdellovibrionales bacterium]|nr:hypothetical protein [Bdellovibrionales bacterium]
MRFATEQLTAAPVSKPNSLLPLSLIKSYLKKYFFICLLCCCACSPTIKERAAPFILDKDTLQIAEDKKTLKGTGRILFKTPLFGLYSTEMYFIKAQLFNESSSLILYSHFTGFAQQDGIKVFFTRDKSSLIVKASATSYPIQTLHTDTSYFTKNQNLEMYIEVQNGTENFISIKIWDAYTNPSGYVKEPARFLSRQNLIVDSRDFLFYSKGQGMLWGVQLNKVSLNFASRESVNQ